MNIKEIDKDTFEEFSKQYQTHYMESKNYSETLAKYNLKVKYLGFFLNGLRSVLILYYKKAFFKYNIGMINKGFISIDDSDISSVLDLLLKYLKDSNFIYLSITPNILLSKREKHGKGIYVNDNALNAIRTFKQKGFKHLGYSKDIQGKKSRFEAVIELENKDSDVLFNDLSKNVRNKLRKSTKYGITVIKDNNMDWKTIWPYIKGYKNVPLNYYKNLEKNFKEDVQIFYAHLDTIKYVECTRKLYEEQIEINNQLSKMVKPDGYRGKNIDNILTQKIESDKLLSTYKKYMVDATNLLKKYPDGLTVGATVIIKVKDTIYLIAEGYNKNFPNLSSTYLTKWKIIEYFLKSEVNHFNLNNITGHFKSKETPYSGLDEMKLGYNALAHEYIGEFEIVLRPTVYNLYKRK